VKTHWQLKSADNSADHKWKIFGVILLVSFFLGLLLAMPVEALRLKTTWAQRVDLSEKIVRGQVVGVTSYWNIEKNLIYTDVTFLIDEHVKGDGLREIRISVPGGTVGDQTHWVSDTPQFGVGDYGIILLESSGQVTGGPDGVYLLQIPVAGVNQLQSVTEDNFLSWIRSYINGHTNVSFEDLLEETSTRPMQQETSYATITGVSPSTVSAGTGDVITITGSGFGTSCCTPIYPLIFFRYKGSSYMGRTTDIVSWSDTEIQARVWTGPLGSPPYPYSPGSWDDTVAFYRSSFNKESTYALTVTFGYGWAKWSASPVSYYINPTGGPTGTETAIQAAADTWSGAGAGFSFSYAGTTSVGYGNDGLNVISFADLGSSTTIAQATTYTTGSTVTQADIQFNTKLAWSTDATTPVDKMDLLSITLHELGHWLRLLDLYGLYDTAKVMYGYGSYGQMKRTLTPSDQQGIQWIYPSFTISGAVTSGGSPLSGVTMNGLPGNPVTGGDGTYSGTVTYGWSGTVTPQKTGYNFTPSSTPYTNVTSNQTQNYTAALQTFTISGTVTSGGSPLSGVTMSGLPGSPVTGANGAYSATVDYGWSGTVTPQKTGYNFTPSSTPYTNITSNQTQNYTAVLQTFTITGTVTSGGSPLSGVTMSGLPGNPVTGGDGTYSGTVTYGWSGTVTPQKTGYNFTPSSTPYTNVTSNQTQNYTAVLQTFTITGTVTSGGSPLSGVTMSGLPGNPVTGGDGTYSGTVTYGWSGTVTPQKTGYNFTPPSTVYTNVTSNQTQNYTAVLQAFTITGTVTWGGSPLSGVTMSGLPGSPVTGANGAYSATVDYGWSGTVTPQKTGYNFTPSSTPYTNVTSNQTQNYTGVLQIEGVIFVSLDGICNFYAPCSSSIQNAISTADTQTTIRITEETYDEDVILNSPKELILQGGWDSTFTTHTSTTTINGSLTISDGTLIVENIVLQ